MLGHRGKSRHFGKVLRHTRPSQFRSCCRYIQQSIHNRKRLVGVAHEIASPCRWIRGGTVVKHIRHDRRCNLELSTQECTRIDILRRAQAARLNLSTRNRKHRFGTATTDIRLCPHTQCVKTLARNQLHIPHTHHYYYCKHGLDRPYTLCENLSVRYRQHKGHNGHPSQQACLCRMCRVDLGSYFNTGVPLLLVWNTRPGLICTF